jgi:hypothetical protein
MLKSGLSLGFENWDLELLNETGEFWLRDSRIAR